MTFPTPSGASVRGADRQTRATAARPSRAAASAWIARRAATVADGNPWPRCPVDTRDWSCNAAVAPERARLSWPARPCDAGRIRARSSDDAGTSGYLGPGRRSSFRHSLPTTRAERTRMNMPAATRRGAEPGRPACQRRAYRPACVTDGFVFVAAALSGAAHGAVRPPRATRPRATPAAKCDALATRRAGQSIFTRPTS